MKEKKVDEQEMAELVEDVLEPTAEERINELTNDLQRTRADFENFRKQVETQKTQAMAVAKYATVEKFLPMLDDIDRAITVYPNELGPLAKNLQKTLKTLGLAKVDSSEGVEFNPDFHEAISVEDEGGDLEVIAETLRPGYLYDGNVVRAAMVKVKKVSPQTLQAPQTPQKQPKNKP